MIEAVTGDADAVLEAFLDWVSDKGIELYDHQEEGILELSAGRNVILNTPTGSGKSMVAMAMQYRALCLGRVSYYTVPIKALANEKFLSLCETFGAENVGLVTGDATVNPEASVICCTAEVLANIALRDGGNARVDDVIMDEFHYYSDRDRGWAWQVPLLTLPQARFLLMSATLGEMDAFQKEMTALTGEETVLVQSEDRPVPLDFSYSETVLSEKVAELVEADRAPIYLVHFTQLACAGSAQALTSINLCSKEEKRAISEILQDGDFRSPYGKEIAKYLRHGIGIHHAGLLPRYRVLVEKLAQKGLLKVICGTDTLGVGVNVPIRTVLFTQLCKYDGSGTGILTVRDFKQVCGRAGRRGFDDIGYVVAQAPEHVIENLKLEAKAAGKKGKVVKCKPPERGFVNWDEGTYQKLRSSNPEKLTSRFRVTHGMLLNVLSRTDEDGCAEMKRIISACHESPEAKRKLEKRAWEMFRGLVEGKVLTIIPPAERHGPAKVRLNVELQEDFSMNHALGLYLLDAIGQLESGAADYPLNVLSLIEAIVEDPQIILRKQTEKARSELVQQLKEEGVGYDERMEALEEIGYPKPGEDFIYDTYNTWSLDHSWASEAGVRPKSIVREIAENYYSFVDYVKVYGLEKSEAVLLRHLSEVYKVLAQSVPPAAKTEELKEVEDFLEDLVRGVDSSLLDEWEMLKDPEAALAKKAAREEAKPAVVIPLSRRKAEFEKEIRKIMHRVLQSLAQENTEQLRAIISNPRDWPDDRIFEAVDTYYEKHQMIRLDPVARAKAMTRLDLPRIEQMLVDDNGQTEWLISAEVDHEQTDEAGTVVIALKSIEASG